MCSERWWKRYWDSSRSRTFFVHRKRNNERVLYGILLEADDFREAQARQELNVKDLLHGGLEFQGGDDPACAAIDRCHAALQFCPPLGQRYAVHGRGGADLR